MIWSITLDQMIRSTQCNHSQSYQLCVKIHQIGPPAPAPKLQFGDWVMDPWIIFINANFLLALLDEKKKAKI